MIIIDTALAQRQETRNPVRVAITGAGFIARGLTNKIINRTPGMELSVIINRTPSKAIQCFTEAGIQNAREVQTAAELTQAIENGQPAYTDNWEAATQCDLIDCLIEGTGAIHYPIPILLDAFEHKKHVVMLNAELDAIIGSVLYAKAQEAGVIYTGCDGDQPGAQINLLRFVKGIGARPLVAGNIKGMLDHYRTPETQASFAKEWGQTPNMVTSFADGTKIAFEQAIVANATGFSIAQRGMLGHTFPGFIDDATSLYDVSALEEKGGIVDYLVGTNPGPGVYIFAVHDDPQQHLYLKYGKLGEGPLYSFYTPYHLCHFEVPNSAARAVLFNDATIAPEHGPQVDVIAIAKTDLSAGTILDDLGGFHTYGVCETYKITRNQNLLTMGQAQGCTLIRPVLKDSPIRQDDVSFPANRPLDILRAEQDMLFPPT